MSVAERNQTRLVINEIFFSIQGESTYAGRPCAFVRLTGCNLRCNYCDTEYAFYEGPQDDGAGNRRAARQLMDATWSRSRAASRYCRMGYIS